MTGLCVRGHVVESKQSFSSVFEADRRAFLDQMCGETVDASLGELLAA